jgi:Carboxypeptidase regulatory-like domain
MSSCSYRLVVVAIALFTVGVSTLSAAQQPTTIIGIVSDQTGASVAGAKVELVNGLVVTRSAATDGGGRYQFEGLQSGDYTVRVTASGFQPVERRVNVTASGSAVADLRLAVQTLEENVVVTAERLKAEVEAFEGGFCATLFQTGRNSLILKRRDVGVVDRARLESDSASDTETPRGAIGSRFTLAR